MTATAYQLGYLQFYFDRTKELLTGLPTSDKETVVLFNREGQLSLGWRPLLIVLGLRRASTEHASSETRLRNKVAVVFDLGSTVTDFLSACWSKPDSRRMLIFLALNLTFMVVEMGYGLYANSLGLVSDAFHMLSDCFSIFVALIASHISSGAADTIFTFGYVRVEVLAGLFNGIFLVLIAFNVFC